MSRIHEALKRAEQEKLARAHKENGDGSSSTVIDGLEAATPRNYATTEQVAAVAYGPAPIQSPSDDPAAADGFPQACAQHSWSFSRNMLFSGVGPQDGAAIEQFRTLRSRLYQLRERQDIKVIAIGSALPGEGKTFVAANLAQVLAKQHGKRVFLIDGDLRRPSLHTCLGAPNTPGLSDFLMNRATEMEVIQRSSRENLYFLPGGEAAANPSDLAGNGRFKLLLDRLRPHCDWIVVDTTPVVPISDATLLAAACDAVLLVVQGGSTPFDMAQRARQEFHRSFIVGVVLNRATASGTSTPYSYYRHYAGKETK